MTAKREVRVSPPQLHPEVAPQVLHFMQVPLRTRVKLPHSPQESPSYPLSRAALICSERESKARAAISVSIASCAVCCNICTVAPPVAVAAPEAETEAV